MATDDAKYWKTGKDRICLFLLYLVALYNVQFLYIPPQYIHVFVSKLQFIYILPALSPPPPKKKSPDIPLPARAVFPHYAFNRVTLGLIRQSSHFFSFLILASLFHFPFMQFSPSSPTLGHG
jgi:hypothetical protein